MAVTPPDFTDPYLEKLTEHVFALRAEVAELREELRELRGAQDDATVDEIAEALGLETELEEIVQSVKACFSAPAIVTAGQPEESSETYLVLTVKVGPTADARKMVQLQSAWRKQIRRKFPEAASSLRLVVSYE